MSFHFASSFEGVTARRRAGEIIDGGVLQGTGAIADDAASRPSFTSDLPPATLSVELGHMGVAVAICANDPGASEGAIVRRLGAGETGPDAIYFQLQGSARASLDPVFAPERWSEARQRAVADDPVVEKLSRALDAAQNSTDVHAGLYADALRLATIVHMLSRHEMPAACPREEAKSAPRPAEARAATSGLPKWRLKRVLSFIEERLDETLTLADMAAAAGLSRMYFAAQFRVATGLRPHEYLLKRRIERAQELLVETAEPLAQIALAVGFQTQAHFTTVFRRFAGETPYRWRCAHRARA